MKTLMISAAVLAVLALPAAAGTKYDRKLEKAAMDIVASKMGALRGGFSYDAMPVFIMAQDTMTTGSVQTRTASAEEIIPVDLDVWHLGLASSFERKVSRIITF